MKNAITTKPNKVQLSGSWRYLLLIIVLLLLSGCSENDRPLEDDPPFDLYTELTTQEDIGDLSEKPFVKGVFPFTLMIFQQPGHNNPQEGQIAILAAPSFDGLDYSPFNSTYMKKEDTAIMQDHGKHPILIDESLAKAERLKIGDTLY